MLQTLKVLILIRCLDVAIPEMSVNALEVAALKIETQVAPALLDILTGTIIVDHVIVDLDPSHKENADDL
jgi:hypothetical protein